MTSRILCVLIFSNCLSAVADAVEPWSDPELPVRDGLLVWLDASRQIAAWANYKEPAADAQDGIPRLSGSDLVDICYDASGNKRHFTQPTPAARPAFVLVDHQAVFRFDGVDDYLVHEQPPRTIEQFTLFVVAAPTSNTSRYRAFFATHQAGQSDYTTGMVVDMAAESTTDLRNLNVEGAGFSAAADLLDCPLELGEFHTLGVTCGPGNGDVAVRLDGQLTGNRKREVASIHVDRMLLGARYASPTGDAPSILGFLHGDIAEVLLFDRVLDESERIAVEKYLGTKE